MDVGYMKDGLSIHEGMPTRDKLGGFDAEGWRIGRHGEAAMGWDGVSSGMARLRRAGMGRGLGKGGVCTFGTRKKSAI